jgi:hypothetical protein
MLAALLRMLMLLLLAVSPGLALRTAAASQPQQQQRTTAAVEALVARRAPLLSPFLELTLQQRSISSSSHEASPAAGAAPEFFSVANSTHSPRNISIVANSPSALALGVHYYIKYVALRQIAWGTSNLDTIAVPPPRPGAEQRHIVSAEWRYAWNVCTHGYTMPWWGWQRWELELVSAGRTIPHHSAPASWDGSRTLPPPDWCDL